MNNRKIRAGILAAVVAATGAFGLAACSSEGSSSSSSSESSAAEEGAEEGGEAAAEDIDVTADLEAARQAVVDGLEEDPAQTQIMLAPDVTEPTYKYGLLVMPFVATDAAEQVTGTVNIDGDGNYTIEAVSAASGTTYQIDQDGTISEVAE